MKIAYFDCFSGAGGDMITAAMLDAGLSEELLTQQISTLGIHDMELKVSQATRCGIKALRFEPLAPHQHHHRHLADILHIINNSGISQSAKERAVEVFKKLAAAEAHVHGTDIESVHFHEVGAVDSIVDIVSACVGIEQLKIEKVYCSPLALGGGTVKSEHGILPVPAPATAELVKNVPTFGGPEQVELLTPTAAAILTTFATSFGAMPAMSIETIGHGAGSRDSKTLPNIVRLVIGEAAAAADTESDYVTLLEANCDDITGELAGHIVERLMVQGALDAFTMPIYMKHSRPAILLSAICKPQDAPQIEKFLFEQGVTLGIRRQIIQRSTLKRDFVTVATAYGDIRIKRGFANDKVVFAKPEFSDCEEAARQHNVPVKIVADAAMRSLIS
ncbi:MAG: nickel pincer cofactor biosynthesis protein LarC [Sedimentisphaerales bacterium]|nr:nickel pincer cofactor biosynthesis protein LarC [Sedimentisphaerales bacterium]